MIDDIIRIWNEITALRTEPGSISARPLDVTGFQVSEILLCITQDGHPGILLRNPGARTPLPRPGCGRLTVRREQLMRDGAAPEDYIRMECLDDSLRQPFAVLASQVVKHLADGATASAACMEAVLEFRRLLSRHGGLLPTDEEILGLTGELLLLRLLVSENPELWKGWNGPMGSSRDFSWGSTDIEAKASRLSGEPRLTVNGLDQLEPEEGRSLFIHHTILSDNPTGPISVPDLADEIRRVISEPEDFDESLAAAGYIEEQKDLWADQRFTLHETSLYHVAEDFPRIRKADFPEATLPPGVSRLRFDVLLASAVPFRLSDAGIARMLRDLASESPEQ